MPAKESSNQLILPEGWGEIGGLFDSPEEKIGYFNQNAITPEQLLGAGQNVTQSDIDWMKQNGYIVGSTPAPTPKVATENTASDVVANLQNAGLRDTGTPFTPAATAKITATPAASTSLTKLPADLEGKPISEILGQLTSIYNNVGATQQGVMSGENEQITINPILYGGGWTASEVPGDIIGYTGEGENAQPIYGDSKLGGFSQRVGDINYHYDANGKFITTTKATSTFLEDMAPVINIGLMAVSNGALGPYGQVVAQGLGLARAIDSGNLGNMVISALGVAGAPANVLGLDSSTLSALSTAKTTAQVVNALSTGDPVAIATSLASTTAGKELLNTDIGGGVSIGDALNVARAGVALTSNNPLTVASGAITLGNLASTGTGGGITNRINDGTIPQGNGSITSTLAGAGLSDGSNNTATDADLTKLLNDALTFDASGSENANAAAAAAKEAGYSQFKFDNKTWTINENEDAKIADFENIVKAETTAANLVGDKEFGDLAGAQAAATARNTVLIGNAEADNPDEAAYLAKLRDPTASQFEYGGKIYTMTASNAQVLAADQSTQTVTKPAGSTATTAKTATSTSTADQSAAETARLLGQNKTLADASTANQSDAETKRLLAQNASLIKGNVTANQSAAEMARLAALNNTLVVGNAPNESTAETQRLMESGSRTAAENLSSMALQALGTTVRGAGSFLTNAGNTYSQITGDFDYANTATRLGKELEEYAKGKDIYGLDVQKTRLNQSLDQADRTNNFWDKSSIIGKAIFKNPLGFFDVAGTEFVEEAPSTALQIAAALATGGGSIAAQTGGRFIAGTASLADSFLETFGSAGKEAYQKSIARGDPKEVAQNKSYINASIHAVAEMVPDFIADKALIAPIMKNFAEKTLTSIGTAFGTNTAAGLVSELVSGAAQSYSTQYVVDPKTASWSKALTDGIFESAIGGTVQTAMASPTTVVDTGAVIGRDYSGKDVTLQQVIDGGSSIDASTVNANTPIATTADGSTLTIGSAMATTSSSNPGLDVFSEFLPANLKGDDVKPVDLGDVGNVVPGDTTAPAGPADLGPVGAATPGADTVTGTDLGAIGSVTPGSNAAVGSNAAAVGASTPGATTVADAQSVMADLGLNVSDDAAVSLASQITNAATQSDTSNVAASIVAGNDASSTVASSIASSVAAGADASSTISSTVGSAITAGADAATVISSAVTSSIGSGVAADAAINSTVSSSIAAGTNASTAVSSTVSSAINAGTSVSTAVGSSVSSAVNAGTDVNTAVAAAVAAAVNTGANVSTVIDAATNAATSTGNNVSITSGENTVTISNATSNTQTTINTSTGVATTFDANTGTTSDVSVAPATTPNVATTQNAATTPNAATAQDVATTQNAATKPNAATAQNVATTPNVTTYLPPTTATPVKPTPVKPTTVTPTTVTPTPVPPTVVEPPVVEPPVAKPTTVAPLVTPSVTPPATTPKVTAPKTTPPTKKQVAQMLGVPASDPVVQDVIEALYGTMDYLDISKEFSASERKAKPAATTKQKQQTKMAEGGYLDALLAEEMSVDDLLNLLR